MNKTKILLFTILIILIATGVLYGIRFRTKKNINTQIDIEEKIEIIASAQYVSETGDEAKVTYYNNDTASLNLIGSELVDINFNLAASASGARYENTELNLVLWEKEPQLTIYKDDGEIFNGTKFEVLEKNRTQNLIISKKWIWTKTAQAIGPEVQDAEQITPNQKDKFSLTFTAENQVSGTTDCNGFGGNYYLDDIAKIRFSSFMSTLMYCEGSQEQEFLSMLKDSTIYINENELILENGTQTIYFKTE